MISSAITVEIETLLSYERIATFTKIKKVQSVTLRTNVRRDKVGRAAKQAITTPGRVGC